MGDNFLKIKKKHMTASIVASAVFGVCLALLCVGAVLLGIKLGGVKIHALYYVLIGVVVCAAAGGVFFLITYPRDKKLAKKLDESYSLGEKVQTMVEFAHCDDTMISLQREDTEAVLGALRPKKIRPVQIAKLAAVPVLSLALFLTGAIVPSRYVQAEEVDPPFNATEVQIIQLTQLIGEVRESALAEAVKDGTVVVLQNLLDGLGEEKTESEMRTAVITTVTLADGILSSANSLSAICANFATTDRMKELANVSASCAFYYRSDNIRLTDFASVGRKAERAEQAVPEVLTQSMKKIKEPWQELALDALSADLTAFCEELSAYTLSGFDERDAFYASLSALDEALHVAVANIATGGYPLANILSQLDEAFASYVKNAAPALAAQSYNTMMNAYVRVRLAAIFNIPESAFPKIKIPESLESGSTTPGTDPGDTEQNGGGDSDKEHLRGGNEQIYYAPEEQYVKYAEKLGEYNAKMLEYLRSGEISEEMQNYIRAYFDILYSNIQEQNAN